jgi:N-acetylmuramoyl-L-alanine amidase
MAILTGIAVYAMNVSAAPPATLYYSQRPAYNIIVDAGHGGYDGGAVSGGVVESGVNLAIALKLDAMMGLLGVPATLTRSSQEIDYPEDADTLRKAKAADSKARMKLIRSTERALLISIHQNNFKRSEAHGAQIFYSKHPGSFELAGIVTRSLERAIAPTLTKAPAPIADTIYLMKNTGCPAILAECGFLSNPEERALLMDDDYRNKIAAALLVAVLEVT